MATLSDSAPRQSVQNLLIQGDNLHAFKSVQEHFAKEVDLIYMDPPYNTKNHKFTYDDRIKEWHDFIYKRLEVALKLLKPDGVLFISIDEKELVALRSICDTLFGVENFVAQFVWVKKKKPSFLHKKIANMVEYILCYAKDISACAMLSVERVKKSNRYPLHFAANPVSELSFAPKSVTFGLNDGLYSAGDMSSLAISATLLDNVIVKNRKNENSFRMRSSWRYTQAKLDSLLACGAELFIHQLPMRLTLKRESDKPKMMRNLLSKESYGVPTYEDATREIVSIFGFKAFSGAKPIKLLQLLVQSATSQKKDATILDMFGGSGSMAEAVIALNHEQNTRCRFCIIQTDEPLSKSSLAYKRGFQTIFELLEVRINATCQKYAVNPETIAKILLYQI